MTSSGDKPRVELDFTVHWCPRHLEPFRAQWPLGAGVAMLRLFEAAVADERIIAAAPQRADGTAAADALDPVLREFSPLCCFLGDEATDRIVEQALAESAELRERARRGEIPPPPATDG